MLRLLCASMLPPSAREPRNGVRVELPKPAPRFGADSPTFWVTFWFGRLRDEAVVGSS